MKDDPNRARDSLSATWKHRTDLSASRSGHGPSQTASVPTSRVHSYFRPAKHASIWGSLGWLRKAGAPLSPQLWQLELSEQLCAARPFAEWAWRRPATSCGRLRALHEAERTPRQRRGRRGDDAAGLGRSLWSFSPESDGDMAIFRQRRESIA
ncbi:hypothetical protein M011DRAFT_19474 [Sporormia fimetaria CBS 119925]|uniref:Uncharacterized protein n=1 Tax=Sporormia fimetaria CBS 119925 TaxID=1340428 RepID=A0A6A6VRP8_9PLEO|nr:hypothetical protein M011DRAFT_19474 [Sporormia fimetaria CBS 119925]